MSAENGLADDPNRSRLTTWDQYDSVLSRYVSPRRQITPTARELSFASFIMPDQHVALVDVAQYVLLTRTPSFLHTLVSQIEEASAITPTIACREITH
ncbi:MAG: hypothetical protein HKP61_19425 [Dactylosporangium sp.]|nr:hypothetical protein [Dactylosporangium sp.]